MDNSTLYPHKQNETSDNQENSITVIVTIVYLSIR